MHEHDIHAAACFDGLREMTSSGLPLCSGLAAVQLHSKNVAGFAVWWQTLQSGGLLLFSIPKHLFQFRKVIHTLEI